MVGESMVLSKILLLVLASTSWPMRSQPKHSWGRAADSTAEPCLHLGGPGSQGPVLATCFF